MFSNLKDAIIALFVIDVYWTWTITALG